MNLLVWVLFIISMSTTATIGCVLIFGKNNDNLKNKLGFFILSATLWASFSFLQSLVMNEPFNIIFARLTFISSLTMAYLMFSFVKLFTKNKLEKISKVFISSSLLLAIFCITPYVISSVDLSGGTVALIRQPLYFVVLLLLLVELLTSIVVSARYYKILQLSKLKSQAKFITTGLVLGILAGVLTNVILPNVAPSLMATRLAWLPTIIWVLTLLYAVVKHRFLDISLNVIKSIGFISTATVSLLLYYVTVFFCSYWFGLLGDFSLNEILINSTLIVLFALVFRPLNRFFDYSANIIFGRVYYSRSSVYTKLTDQIVRTDTVDDLQKAVIDIVGNALNLNNLGLMLIGSNLISNRSGRLSIDETNAYINDLSDTGNDYLWFDPYDLSTETSKISAKKHISVVFPIYNQKDIVGIFYVGQLSARLYTNFDIEFLQTITDEISITVEKLNSVEMIKSFNKELKKEVQDATKQLRESNEKLIVLDATKDEFISMASHQLRTPLTSVKGYISMVLEGDAGKITKEQKQLLEEAYTSSERMVHLIGDFLNVSRLQTGKFIIDTHPTDLATVTAQEVEGMQQIAQTHGIKINYKQPTRIPNLYLDENKLRQVIMNFIDNAIYYSPESKTIKLTLGIEDGEVVLRVIDKGLGVPAEFHKKLFTKFSRADNARKQRPDGTGIGLYLAKKVILGHGGQVIFESKEGIGSTFGFRLPIKKLQTPPPQKQIT